MSWQMGMSKTSKKYGEELYRKIQDSRESLKQLLSEYRASVRDKVGQNNGHSHSTTLRLQRSLNRAVAKYTKLCKALDQYQDRIQKKKTPA
jgi:hypothetical protein